MPARTGVERAATSDVARKWEWFAVLGACLLVGGAFEIIRAFVTRKGLGFINGLLSNVL
jgi:uncharacterized membrane protein HdeD (DUF308 family)